MSNKIFSQKAKTNQDQERQIPQIIIKIPDKYTGRSLNELHLDTLEENALFSYLTREFFKQIDKHKILANDCISELAFLCESYFDFKEFSEEVRFQDDFDLIYT